jgi:hypothetical protein
MRILGHVIRLAIVGGSDAGIAAARSRCAGPPTRGRDGCWAASSSGTGTQVAARIDVPAAALHAGWTIDRINDLDLSYTPPFGSPWDALQVGAQVWQNVANAVRPGRAIARGGLRRRRP